MKRFVALLAIMVCFTVTRAAAEIPDVGELNDNELLATYYMLLSEIENRGIEIPAPSSPQESPETDKRAAEAQERISTLEAQLAELREANELLEERIAGLSEGGAPDAPTGDAQEQTEQATYRPLKNFDVGEEVRNLNQRLIDLGYLQGKAYSFYNERTEDAVRAFQEEMGLPADGLANEQTLEALYEDAPESSASAAPAPAEPKDAPGASKPRNYSDDEIASLLPSGRWTWTDDSGTAFLDFADNHKGQISGLTDFTWSISDGSVFIDFATDQAYHKEFVFSVTGGTAQLENDGHRYILDGAEDNMIKIIGTWRAVGDDSVELILNSDANFEIKVGGLVYKGTWGIDGSTLVLTQKGINVYGQFNGSSIGLSIAGKNFTFKK